MRKDTLVRLRQVADGLAALGKPGKDNRQMAMRRLALMEQFERLVRAASAADRHAIAQTLKDMLQEAGDA